MVLRRLALLATLWALAPALWGQALGNAGFAVLDVNEAARPFVSGPINGVSQTPDGVLVVSSDRLSTFDGEKWRAIKVAGIDHFYASAASLDGKRVWITTDDQIGYIERSGNGDWDFTSLRHALEADHIEEFDEVRHVHPTPDGAIFVARNQVIRWDGVHFRGWHLPSMTRLYAAVDGSELFIHQSGVGLLHFEADGPRLQVREADLPGIPPLVAWLTLRDGRRLAVTHEGIFVRVGDRWERQEAATQLLGGRRALHAAVLSDGSIALGTSYGGLVLLRPDGQPLGLIDPAHGMRSNDVTALSADSNGRLWIGTTTGLTRLSGAGWASLFDWRARLATRDVRQIIEQDGQVLALASPGLYKYHPGQGFQAAQFDHETPALIPLHSGVIVEGQLWVAGPTGIWLDNGISPVPQPQETNPVEFTLKLGAFPHGFVYLDATSVKTWLKNAEGRWEARRLHEFSSAPLTAAEDSRGDLWIATADGNIQSFRWDAAAQKLVLLRAFRREVDLAGIGSRVRVVSSLNDIWALGELGVMRYSSREQRFESPAEFRGLAVAGTANCASGAYWAISRPELGPEAPGGLLRLNSESAHAGTLTSVPLFAPGLDQIGRIQRVDVTREQDREILWVIGSSAVLRLDAQSLMPAAPVPALQLQGVQLDEAGHWPLDAASSDFPAGIRRITIELSPGVAATADAGLLFQSRLEGKERDWSPPKAAATCELAGLASGSYLLQARAVDRFGRTGPVFDYPFILAAPWYNRPAAWAIWIALAVAILAAAVRARFRILEKQTARLNQLVEDRTRELSLSNAAKSEFLDTISHEIRDPLNGIVGLVAVLSESGLTSEQLEQTEALRQCSASLTRMMSEVLNLSRLEYGLITLEEGPFCLIDLVQSICSLQAASAQRQGCVLTVRTDENFVDGFYGDQGKIRTILNNFVSNGLKYAPGFPIEIGLSHLEQAPTAGETSHCEVLIEVADQGPGVPEAEQELIFKKFVRGSRAKESPVTGVGMGLATCRVMAQLLGGNVSIENGAERGAIFSLTVPLRREAVPPNAPAGGPLRFGGIALIVDDQHYNRVVMTGIARSLGFEPRIAGNAEAAMALLEQTIPRVILIDVELPGTRGPELTRQIRSRPAGAEPLILATSADDRPATRSECRRAGMDGFLIKPVDRAKLESALLSAQDERHPVAPLASPLDSTALGLYEQAGLHDLPDARAAYCAALQAELSALEIAIRESHTGKIVQAAHRLRSHAALVNATALSHLAAELEFAARSRKLRRVESLWQAIVAAASAVEAQIMVPRP